MGGVFATGAAANPQRRFASMSSIAMVSAFSVPEVDDMPNIKDLSVELEEVLQT